MTNKTGYILGLISAFIYVIIIYGFSTNRLSEFLASLLAALIVPALVGGLISLFSKNNFGKIFGITCVIIHVISGLGNSLV